MFKIRRIGTDAHENKDFRINRMAGYDCWLFLFVKSEAVFYINGAEVAVKPDTYILYQPGTPHFYRASAEVYINDWVQFETDMAVTDIVTDRPVYLGNSVDIGSYMQLIGEAFYRENRQSYEHLLLAMLLELSFVSGNSTLKGSHSHELAELRRELYRKPEAKWSIRLAAERLYLSAAHFQELYKKAFGVSFGSDLIKSRIEAATELLLYTDRSVTEIGYQCGYSSPVHFSRQFSKLMGISPSEWRKKHCG